MNTMIQDIVFIVTSRWTNMELTFYTTGCPKCGVLKHKLDQKKLEYKEVTDVDVMLKKGLHMAPALQIDDEPPMPFFEAVKWLNKQED